MGLYGLLDIARTGIAAQSGALGITGQNVANATTPGYTRRVAVLSGRVDGGGVELRGELRSFDRFAYAHVVDQQGRRGSAEARATGLARIEALVAPPGETIATRATALFAAFDTLAGYPTDMAVRSAVLARADDFARGVTATSQALTSTASDLHVQAQAVVKDVNERLGRVADLNERIKDAVARGDDAATLRDQRDVAVREISERLGVRAVGADDGGMALFGAGTLLVEGGRVSPLAVDLDPAGKLRITVAGATNIDITSRVDSGMLGGIREVRDVDLAKTRDDLDRYAFDVATTINGVHANGFGLDGGTGRPLFTPLAGATGAASALSLDAAMVDRPDFLGASQSPTDIPGGNGIAGQLSELGMQQAFGGSTVADRFASLAADLGTRKASADADLLLREDTLAMAETLADSASGVSLDEEMVDMTRYQRAFEAASRVLRAADELLDQFLRSI